MNILTIHSTFIADKLIKNDSRYEVDKNKLILKKVHTNLPPYYKCVIELKTIGAKFAVMKKIENHDFGKKDADELRIFIR